MTATADAPAVVLLDRVSMQFGAHQVLRDITLAVHRGETVLVIGESGCGKTVLLKLVVGLLRPTAGRVLVRRPRPRGTLGGRNARRSAGGSDSSSRGPPCSTA